MDVCKCTGNRMGNTGVPGGAKPYGKTIGLFFVPTFANDGSRNRIDCSVDFDDAYILARLNDPDPSKRWYPVMNLKNVAQPKADPVTQSIGDGTEFFIEEGIRSFSTEIFKDAVTQYLGKLKQGGCASLSVFKIDNCGQPQGEENTPGFLDPILLADETFNAFMQFATDTTIQSIIMNFQFDKLVRDEALRYISAESIVPDLRKVTGLIDLTGTTSAVTTLGATVTIVTDYGTCGAAIPFKSGVQADFVDNADTPSTVYNVTDDTSIPVTVDVTNAKTGAYVLTHAALIAKDIEVRLRKDGFEMVVAKYTTP